MNQKQWKAAKSKVSSNDRKKFFYFRNLAVKELGLRKGYVIHHLRDTEEQRIFNDTYYERWGYDFDGVCKYCVPMKVEDHRAYHRLSEETRKKISDSNKATKSTAEYKERVSGKNSYMYGKHREFSDAARQKISEGIKEFFKDEDNRIARSNALKEYYKNNPLTDEDKKKISEATKEAMKDPTIRKKLSDACRGRILSDDHKKKISDGNKGKIRSEDSKQKISSSLKGHTVSEETRKKLSDGNKGKTRSEETKRKMRESNYSKNAAILYKEYKSSGGILNWNQWQKMGYPTHDMECSLDE